MSVRQIADNAKSYHSLALRLFSDYKKLAAVHQQYGTWHEAFLALDGDVKKRDSAWELLHKMEIQLILRDSSEFPALLSEIPFPPHGLYIKGQLPTAQHSIAIVGTRKATAAGLTIAQKMSSELVKAGVVIVSGMALGIDAAAHEGALAHHGKTVAVLACGLDTFYPRQNEQLALRILKNGGAIISEYAPGSPALQQRFLERNRITSGLANGVLVIESPMRSGVKSTVRFAVEQNREVFVVPGPITHPNYEGSHEIIKSGAQLVTGTSDILQELGIESKRQHPALSGEEFDKREKKHKIIIQALAQAGTPLSCEQLVELTSLSVAEVAEVLTLLMLEDTIKEESGRYLIT